jgi:hypothetical protein
VTVKNTIGIVVCILSWVSLAACTSSVPAGVDHQAVGGATGHGGALTGSSGTPDGAVGVVGTGGSATTIDTGGALGSHDASDRDLVSGTTDAGIDLAPAPVPPDAALGLPPDVLPMLPLDTASDLSRDLSSEPTAARIAFTSVVVGGGAVCGLKTDGGITCWGQFAPVTLPSGPFTSISLGGWSCGARADHTLVCWDATSGEVLGATQGDGAPPPGSYTSVSVGYVRACAVRVDGSVTCWGGWDCTDQETPPSGTFVSVSSGDDFACSLRTNGTIACWNQCASGGIPKTPSGTFKSVSVGNTLFACAVKEDGTIACWGDNDAGQSTPPSGTFIAVSAGLAYACGLRTDGTIACWGDNESGRATPPSGTFTSIDVTYDYGCAVRTDGSPVCWGNTSDGQNTPPAQ